MFEEVFIDTKFTSVLISIRPSEEWSLMASSLPAQQILVPAREKTEASLGPPYSSPDHAARPLSHGEEAAENDP